MSGGRTQARPQTVVDARGHRCPVPTLRLRRALEDVEPGETVVLLADDPMARIDVPHLLAHTGDELVAAEAADGALRFEVRKSPSAGGAGRGPRPD